MLHHSNARREKKNLILFYRYAIIICHDYYNINFFSLNLF